MTSCSVGGGVLLTSRFKPSSMHVRFMADEMVLKDVLFSANSSARFCQ